MASEAPYVGLGGGSRQVEPGDHLIPELAPLLATQDAGWQKWFEVRTGASDYYHFSLFENDHPTRFRPLLLVSSVIGGELLARAGQTEDPRDHVNGLLLHLLWRWNQAIVVAPAGFTLDQLLGVMRPDVARSLGEDVGSGSVGRWESGGKEFLVWALL